ncbi:MAG: hypothetical protein E7201_08465 [Selenomonas ruminantium]|jgi:hypothetical protein|uniref:Uncharacterized protein n=1 Tax=Selenomonas ruminantium TaxID=971 RepID=A0A927WQ45_SELRU|nr:hypothetical protein [Selenomonas ruminantium]
MADTWQWNDFIEVESGDTLRSYAREHNLFVYPYDLFTGAEIAMFKNVKVQDQQKRFIVCALNDMNEKDARDGQVIYEIKPWARMCEWESSAADSYEGAIVRWNKRMKKTAVRMLKPPIIRFITMEYSAMVTNIFVWGFLFFVLSFNSTISDFFHSHYILTGLLFVLLCSNIKNIFIKSYGEEIPRETLRSWAYVSTHRFNEAFYEKAMRQREDLRQLCENSVPLYLLWQRGKLNPAAPLTIESADDGNDTGIKIYCQEIRNSLNGQISEISDLRTRIPDGAVKRHIEGILKTLQEIQQAISFSGNSAKVLSARRIVSYWNDELLSLLKSYMDLLNNSSAEAAGTKDKIEAVLQDLSPVYKKELGRITKAETMEIDAAIDIMRKEIDQVMEKGR